jgi:osmotically-inducible protein OsmY
MKNQENSTPSKKSPQELYEELRNDNELNDTLMGFSANQLELRNHADDEMERVIEDLLKSSSRLDSRELSISVDKCNVTLSGRVKSQTERDYAL